IHIAVALLYRAAAASVVNAQEPAPVPISTTDASPASPQLSAVAIAAAAIRVSVDVAAGSVRNFSIEKRPKKNRMATFMVAQCEPAQRPVQCHGTDVVHAVPDSTYQLRAVVETDREQRAYSQWVTVRMPPEPTSTPAAPTTLTGRPASPF